MNCKQGDLAIVVRSVAGNEGKIVRCVRLMGPTRLALPDWKMVDPICWEIDRHVFDCFGIQQKYFPDECLRPLRDPGDDAQDETLTWLDVPSEVTA